MRRKKSKVGFGVRITHGEPQMTEHVKSILVIYSRSRYYRIYIT